MNYLIVLVSFATLSLVAAYNPSNYTPTRNQKEENEQGITDLILTPRYRDDRRCQVMTPFVASICSVPSHADICQSDCKFLLQQMWDHILINERPSIEELKAFVPDRCVPNENTVSLNAGRCQLYIGYEQQNNNQVVSDSEVTCREQGSNGRNYTLLGGDLWIDNCRTSRGQILGVCLESGYLFKSYRNCH